MDALFAEAAQALQANNWDGARQALERAVEGRQRSGPALAGAGRFIVDHQMYAAFRLAKEYLREAEAVNACNAGDLAALGHVLWVLRERDPSIEAYRKSLQLNPGAPGSLRGLGFVHLAARQHLDAFIEFSAALGLGDNSAKLGQTCALRLLTGNDVVTINQFGRTFRFRISGQALGCDLLHLSNSLYEAKEMGALLAAFPSFRHIVDVGGNIGNHSVFFQCAYTPDTLDILEPNPRCVEILSNNLALNDNGVTRWTVHPCGAGREQSTMYQVCQDELNAGLAQEPGANRIEVAVNRLDSLVDKADLIKIDVERMELDVLAGADRLIDNCRPVVYAEVHLSHEYDFACWLRDKRYSIVHSSRYPAHANMIVAPVL